MASSLTKEQQLSAANAQYKNWVNQQIAANGGYYPTINQINQYKASILNTGLYPDLDIGVPPPAPGVDVNIAPDQFFIVGQGGDLKEDRGSGFTGNPIFTGGISDDTTLEQFAAAQDAYGSALQAQQDALARSSAAEAQAAQNALAAAQARVKALEAQLTADSIKDPTPPTSSSIVQGASSSENQRRGQEISPTGAVTDPTTLTEQYSQYRSGGTVIQNSTPTSNVSRQEQLDRINDSYTATSSGSGTDVTTQTPPTTNNTALQNYNRDRLSDATAVSNTPSGTNNSVAEDNPQNGATSGSSDTAVYTDQQVNGMRGRGLPDTNPSGTTETTNGSNSVSILKQGAAYGAGSQGGTPNQNSSATTGGTSVRPNKLHNYVNNTYRLSLFAANKETINNIFSADSAPTNQQILQGASFICSDSGAGQNTRSPEFPVDLTIDNLELETIVNANSSRTRATDVVKLSFDIIEPYTVNFLARLKTLSDRINPNANWSTLFFILKIEFMGYTDAGMPINSSSNGDVIPNTTKFIPFTMVNMKFKVTSNGGKYSVDGVPTNALALTALDNQIPFHVELSGTTVNDIFNGDLSSGTTTVSGGRVSGRDEAQVFTTTQNTVGGSNTTVKKGLATALNNNEDEKKNQGSQEKPQKYKFEFDKFIGQSTVLDPSGYFKVQGVPGTSGKDPKEIEQGKVGSLVADLSAGVFRANPGTRITDFINSVITVSRYMLEQYNNSNNATQPLTTWKITPVVKFLDIDQKTNFYAREITYVVKPYEVHGEDAPNFGQASVPKNRIVKTYKYIYSGNNQDVIDADINFQVAFFEIRNGVPFNYIDREGNPGGQQTANQTGAPSTIPRFFMPRYHYTNGLANRQNTGPTTVDLASIGVQNLMEKIYDNRGDMNTLDITIVGDPDWISQDYLLMHPNVVGKDTWLANGSINFSNSVYFNFYFATPNTDYNDVTGLFDDKNNYSEFSGIYKVVSIKSSFSGGKFTQKLTNVRVRNQEAVQTTAIRKDTVNPNAPTASNNAGNAPLEKATNSVLVPNDPRLNIAVGTNTGPSNSQPTYNITDPRVGIIQPQNTWNEDTAIRDYYLGIK